MALPPARDATAIATLEAQLAVRAEAFIAANGRRPEQADIAADAAWAAAFEEKRALERAGATQLPGGCSVYIVRRRRYCSHAAADGLGGLCSEHAAVARAEAAAAASGGGAGDESAPAAPPLLPSRVPDAPPGASPSSKRNLKRRMKRMTNPHAHAAPVAAPDWGALFADASLPTLLDIGCAKGRFLAALSSDASFAAAHGAHNFVGVEVFAPLTVAANAWRDAAGARNLHYVAANAATSLAALRVPRLRRVCIMFPDPWRDDCASRRVVTPALADTLAALLPPGGEVFLVSDVRRIAAEMRAVLLAQGGFALHALHATAATPLGWGEGGGTKRRRHEPRAGCDGDERDDGGASVQTAEAAAIDDDDDDAEAAPPEGGWLRVRPYGVPTERDKVCEKMWRPVFRTLLVRT